MISSLRSRTFVIDANVLFSCLISGRDHYLTFLTENHLFTTDFLFEELQIHQTIISRKTRLTAEQLQPFILAVFEQLTVVPNMVISTQNYYQAFMLCRDIDPKDTPYVALALQLDIPLLTRDKPLADGLRAKNFANVIILSELFNQVNDSESID